MGLDCILFAVTEVSSEQVDALIASAPPEFEAKRVAAIDIFGQGQIAAKRPEQLIVQCGEFWRYYRICYERGPWVDIVRAAHWLRDSFPSRKVYYGPDNDWPSELTPEREQEISDHFFSEGNEAYYERFVAAGIPVSQEVLDKMAKRNT